MSRIRTRKFREIEEVDVFLAGGLIGGADIINGVEGNYGINGLVGLTLKLKKPTVKTVTFVNSTDPNNPNPSRLTYKDLKSQIEAVATDVSVQQLMRKIVLIEVTPANGVTVDKTGTATRLLGFDANADTVGTFYGVGATPPSFQCAYSTNDNMHVILTLE